MTEASSPRRRDAAASRKRLLNAAGELTTESSLYCLNASPTKVPSIPNCVPS